MSIRGNIAGIGYLRGAAAVMVAAVHSSNLIGHPEYFGETPFNTAGVGNYRVAILFLISGFVNLIASAGLNGRARPTPADFLIRRAIRLIPMMWIAIIAYNAISSFGRGQLEPMAILASLTLWPFGELRPNVLWTMRHEAMFLAFFAFALLGGRRRLMLLTVWGLSPLVMNVLLDVRPHLLSGMNVAARDLLLLLFQEGDANFLFLGGMAAGWLVYPRLKAGNLSIPGGAAMVYALVIAGTCAFGFFNTHVQSLAAKSLIQFLLVFAVFLPSLTVLSGHGWIDRLGRILGESAYSIFLFHSLIIMCALECAVRLKLNAPVVLIFFVIAPMVVACGVAIHYWIEVPLLRWLMGRYQALRTRRAVIADPAPVVEAI